MPKINERFLNLNASYLFAEIKRRQAAFREAHPTVRLIDLGVGDVTRPLPPAVVQTIHAAADEMARAETFKGYGPYVGYEFLRAKIAAHDFGCRGVRVDVDEIFVSDGGKSDSANLQETPTSGSKTPASTPSWDFFDRLLAEAHVVGTPGSGFGPAGEGYFRLTAFGSRAETEEAVERIAGLGLSP